MASSKKPASSKSPCCAIDNRLVKHLEGILAPLVRPHQKLLIAFSGGLDSRALLELLVLLQPALKYELQAMHVHHGLSPNADRWADFCTQTCRALDVPVEVVHVEVTNSGHGTEAAARKARYTALDAVRADFIVLAHHEGDQAETLLLQMLRGGGVKGLSAMAMHDAQRKYLRPLLQISRADLLDFATLHQLQWIEDESNADIGYDRNYCRHQILPVIEQRFPAARHTLARTARHLAEASDLLDDLAKLDAASCSQDGRLDVVGLKSLSEPRARNLVRWWLSSLEQPLPSMLRLQEMLRQLLSAAPDADIKIAVDNGVWLRRYRNLVYLDATDFIEPSDAEPLDMVWQGEPELYLPDHSKLLFEEKHGDGLAIRRLGIDRLRICRRQGGERFKPDAQRPTRTLKHLLQEAGMPPWLRRRLPLLYWERALAVVPGIGIAAGMQAADREPGLVITWLPS
jgi:tRNA(Ile)-lysidine synthase